VTLIDNNFLISASMSKRLPVETIKHHHLTEAWATSNCHK